MELVHFLLLTVEYAIGLVFEKGRSVLLNLHDVKETLAGPIVGAGRPPRHALKNVVLL